MLHPLPLRMQHDFGLDNIVGALITLLVVTLFIYFAAKFVLARSSFFAALGTALLGTFLASIVVGLLVSVLDAPAWVFFVIGIAIWSLVAAFFFRARWVQGAIIGLVAWLLWALVHWVIGMVF